MPELQVGDVALDKTQGRPVHIVEDCGQTAAEWSEANNYDLLDNYGNGRCDAEADDAVYEVVFCSNAKSEPSKTYAMPDSRLLRVETEAADDGRPVAERAVRDVLEQLFDLAMQFDDEFDIELEGFDDALMTLAVNHSDSMADLGEEARELADVSHTIGEDDDAE